MHLTSKSNIDCDYVISEISLDCGVFFLRKGEKMMSLRKVFAYVFGSLLKGKERKLWPFTFLYSFLIAFH